MYSYTYLKYAILLPAILSIYYRRQFKKEERKDIAPLEILIFIGAATDIAVEVLALYEINFLILYHIYTPIEAFFAVYLLTGFSRNKVIKVNRTIIALTAGLITAFGSLSEPLAGVDKLAMYYETLIIIPLAAYSFPSIARDTDLPILKNWAFYVTLSFCIYFAANTGYILTDQYPYTVWTIHCITNFFCNLLYAYAIGIYYLRKREWKVI